MANLVNFGKSPSIYWVNPLFRLGHFLCRKLLVYQRLIWKKRPVLCFDLQIWPSGHSPHFSQALIAALKVITFLSRAGHPLKWKVSVGSIGLSTDQPDPILGWWGIERGGSSYLHKCGALNHDITWKYLARDLRNGTRDTSKTMLLVDRYIT